MEPEVSSILFDMRRFVSIIILVILISFSSCTGVKNNQNLEDTEKGEYDMQIIQVSCNDKTLSFMPSNNASALAFVQKLKDGDIQVVMHDYGNFEKVGNLGFTLPQSNEQISTVPGDVILYQGSSVTIYYDENNWNFTRLGLIPNMTRETMLAFFGGSGEVTVTFSLK